MLLEVIWAIQTLMLFRFVVVVAVRLARFCWLLFVSFVRLDYVWMMSFTCVSLLIELN